MPLLRLDLIEGRDKASLKKLLDVVHETVVEAFDVPQRDRYQIVHVHPADEMIIEDTGLGFNRTNNLVVLSIVSKARPKEKKQKLYALLAERLEAECGIAPTDLMVSIVENNDADWSFGQGEAQFLTGKL
ncbi:tautomerase family protein [Paenibacillus filicis]|uniref:Tautomerase family protein n=1 Tax=Paenibacillus gyeongsangnamensis TaxID=3388067 RepID=A0ABT4Q935_9BACL|nr:tautomerase family protein [Paenibacillus filicis]MCZ8513205.1 tautomerase family protein [Paenibacillus filicis]